MPAFADAHTHLPQFRIRQSGKAILYDWLRDIVFPEEARFIDAEYTTKVTNEFFTDLAKNGTLLAMIYLSPFFETISSISQLPLGLNRIYFKAGPILMNNGNKFNFESDTETILENAEETASWLKQKFLVSPRYAPICDEKLLRGLAEIASEHDLFIQTHLGELPDEFEKARSNFPNARFYTEIFANSGLLTNRTIFGHCLYLEDEDYKALAKSGALVAHLPVANEALGSGRMPLEKLRKFEVNWALGTDVGASPTLSMLAVMQSFIRSHEKFTNVTACEALYRATRALPEFLAMQNHGQIKEEASANLILVKSDKISNSCDAESTLRTLIEGNYAQLEEKVTATVNKGKIIAGTIEGLNT